MADVPKTYELQDLIITFQKHVEEYQKSPHYKEVDFNLPKAFLTICQEIQNLKNEK